MLLHGGVCFGISVSHMRKDVLIISCVADFLSPLSYLNTSNAQANDASADYHCQLDSGKR